jgi:general stress protein YciG
MDKERVKKIAASGGRRAHELGVAYTWDAKAATKAGAKGGKVRRRYLDEAVAHERGNR